jgi:hypothetical protein
MGCRTLALLVTLAVTTGCGSTTPRPQTPPSGGITPAPAPRFIAAPPEPEITAGETSIEASRVLPSATSVAVVHVRRLLELKVNPILLRLAAKLVADDCLLQSGLSIERLIVSHDGDSWVAAVDGDLEPDDVLACLAKSPTTTATRYRGEDALLLGFGAIAVEHGGAVLVAEEAALGRTLGPRANRDPVMKVLALVPERDDALIVVGSRWTVDGALTESSGYVTGDLEALKLHSSTTVHDEQLKAIVRLFPLLKGVLRPTLEQMLGGGAQVERALDVLDDLEVKQDGDKLELDLVVHDVEDLVAAVIAEG